MASEVAKGDANNYRVMQGVTNDVNQDTKMVRIDSSTGGLVVAGTIATTGYSTVTSGTFTTTGTAGVRLVSIPTPCKMITLAVPLGNTGTQIAFGGSTVNAISGSEQGHIIIKGGTDRAYLTDASNLYIALDTANDKVSYNIYN